jgi:hypothetical protein
MIKPGETNTMTDNNTITDQDRVLSLRVHALATLRQTVMAQIAYDIAMEDGDKEFIRFARINLEYSKLALKGINNGKEIFDMALKQPSIDSDRKLYRELMKRITDSITEAASGDAATD